MVPLPYDANGVAEDACRPTPVTGSPAGADRVAPLPEDQETGGGVAERVGLLRARAENVFRTGQLLCTESVLSVLNRGLGGDLSDSVAVRLASGMPEGLGSGCMCGALNGGALALGLFLGRNGPGIGNNRRVKAAVQELHDAFRRRFGSTCCRVLTRNLAYGSRDHFRHCAGLTGAAAEMAARIVLDRRPDLLLQEAPPDLRRSDTRIGAGLRRIARLFRY